MKTICAGFFLCAALTSQAQSTGTQGVLVKTQPPRLQAVELSGRYPAEVLPLRRAVLAAELPATVDMIETDWFEPVKKGQVLVQLDTRSLEIEIQRAQAQYEMRRRHLERAKGLIVKKAITDANFLETATAYRVAELDLQQLQLQLDKSSLRAPWPGSVEALHVEVGDYVNPGQPMITLVDHLRLKIRATVPASDASTMKPGLSCWLTIQPQNLKMEGKIDRIAPVMDPDSRTLLVEMVVDSRDGEIRPGSVAYLNIVKTQLQDQLSIPFAAAIETDGRQFVFVVEDGKADKRTVRLGPVFGERVVVSEGLSSSDQVVVQGQQWLTDGQSVRVSEEGSP